jgi:REP element-mobilizing transposase RayT
MANHVHMLITPKIDPSRMMQSLKGYTARESNRLLNRTGDPFWQSESYDHWIRDEAEFDRIRRYIEENPVHAGLASTPGQHRWSSAHRFP